MKKDIEVSNLNTGCEEDASVELANVCPFCGHALSPELLYTGHWHA